MNIFFILKKKRLPLLILVILTTLNGCTTYYISIDSLKQQFSDIDSTKLKAVSILGGGAIMSSKENYMANPIKTIKCTDKKGNPAELENGPSIEIRFTYGKKNKRTVFYFDRTYVNDSAVTGVESRFFSSIRKTIPLDSITKIEIQDGKKNYHYDKHY